MTIATQDKADSLDMDLEALAAMYNFLDSLRETKEAADMYKVGIYLEREFGMGKRLANKVLSAWMEDFR